MGSFPETYNDPQSLVPVLITLFSVPLHRDPP